MGMPGESAVPVDFQLFFAEIRRFHTSIYDSLYDNLMQQMPTFEKLIVQAHQASIAEINTPSALHAPAWAVPRSPSKDGVYATAEEEAPLVFNESSKLAGVSLTPTTLQPRKDCTEEHDTEVARLHKPETISSPMVQEEVSSVVPNEREWPDLCLQASGSTSRPSEFSVEFYEPKLRYSLSSRMSSADNSMAVGGHANERICDAGTEKNVEKCSQEDEDLMEILRNAADEGDNTMVPRVFREGDVIKRWQSLLEKVMGSHLRSGLVQLRSEWAAPKASAMDSLGSYSTYCTIWTKKSLATATMDTADKVFAGTTIISASFLQKLYLHPDSLMARFMLVIGSVALAYDIISVPYVLCFEVEADLLSAVDLFLTIFWTCDLVASCLTGYHSKAHIVEMRPLHVLKHYFMKWGLLDLFVVLSDWLGVVMARVAHQGDRKNSWIGVARTLKYYRFLRVLRMLRLLKVCQGLRFIVDSVAAEAAFVIARLVANIILVLLFNHYIACVWCALARYNSSNGTSWNLPLDVEPSRDFYLYIVALHWAMTQFTPATNNVSPTNTQERVFALSVVLFALIVFSSFVGSLTNAISELKRMHFDRYTEEARIRKFIVGRRVSIQCARKIWQFYWKTYDRKSSETMFVNDLEFFMKMPRGIRMALHHDISMPIMRSHLVFHYLEVADRDIALSVCDAALLEVMLHAEQEVFQAGTKGEVMHILKAGCVRYDSVQYEDFAKLQAPDFISEISIWAFWLHVGNLNTVVACHVLNLDAREFSKVIMRSCDQTLQTSICSYAATFVQLHCAGGTGDDALTDIVPEASRKQFQKNSRRIAWEAFHRNSVKKARFSTTSMGSFGSYTSVSSSRSWGNMNSVFQAGRTMRTTLVTRLSFDNTWLRFKRNSKGSIRSP